MATLPFVFVLLVGGSTLTKKKKTITSVTFFDGFPAKKWATYDFFGGFVAKKVTRAISSPSYMVEHVKKAMSSSFRSCFFYRYGLVH